MEYIPIPIFTLTHIKEIPYSSGSPKIKSEVWNNNHNNHRNNSTQEKNLGTLKKREISSQLNLCKYVEVTCLYGMNRDSMTSRELPKLNSLELVREYACSEIET